MKIYSQKDLFWSAIFTFFVIIIAIASTETIIMNIASMSLIQQVASVAIVLLDIGLVAGTVTLTIHRYRNQESKSKIDKTRIVLLAIAGLTIAAGPTAMLSSFTVVAFADIAVRLFIGIATTIFGVFLWFVFLQRQPVNSSGELIRIFVISLTLLPTFCGVLLLPAAIWVILSTHGAQGWIELAEAFGFLALATTGFYGGLRDER